MKQALRRLTALMLSTVLLLVPMQLSPATASAQTTDQPTLAFVPLDNRPVCVDRVIYATNAAGFDIEMPEEDFYRTYLDDQGVNSNGTQHGNGTAIMAWLNEMDANGCDYFVIHLDQMFSGGLVGSRHPDNEVPDSVTDVEASITEEELAIMQGLIALSADTANHVYFVDTVMRLASTGGYKGLTTLEYSSFRNYASLERMQFDASNFDTTDYQDSLDWIKTIYENYQIGSSGETLHYVDATDIANGTYSASYYAALTQDMVDSYHFYRLRKMALINRMMQYGNNNAYYIIGVDDASPQITIQTNEINFIKARMAALGYNYSLSADTDSSGLMAVARCVNDYYNAQPTAQVRYYGNKADEAADGYDIGTLRENVTEHLKSLNCTIVDSDADLEVLVLTRADSDLLSGEDTTYTANINALVAQAKANIEAGVPTIIIEASTESGYFRAWVKNYTNLQDELIENIDMARLLGYSNWNTVGNSIGIALGTGVSRYTYLAYADQVTGASNRAFVQSIAYSYVKDIAYNARNKNSDYTWTFQYWVKKLAGGSGWTDGNFYAQMVAYDNGTDSCEDWELCDGENYVNQQLEACIMNNDNAKYADCANAILNNLAAGEMYTDLSREATTCGVGTITLDNFHCPWYRQFEITFSVDASVEYYQTVGALMTQILQKQTASEFAQNAINQYVASSVTVTDFNGDALDDTAYIGTGYTVTLTVNGTNVSYTAVVRGEVDGDGVSDTSDVRGVMRRVVKAISFSDAQEAAADYNGDGRVTSTDARQMLQDTLGK